VTILSPKNVRFELRDPDLIQTWDICNIYLEIILKDFEIFTMVPTWVLVHPRLDCAFGPSSKLQAKI